MKTVEIQVLGRYYNLACDEGQEAHVRQLGEGVNARLRELKDAMPSVQESMLFVMAMLMMADELAERAPQGSTPHAQPAEASGKQDALSDEGAARHAEILDRLAEKIESIAEALENQ